MAKYNLKMWGSTTFTKADECKIMRQRRLKYEDHPKICRGCDKVFSNRTFSKHVKKCTNPSVAALVKPIDKHIEITNTHKDQAFIDNILSKFTENKSGNLCRSDALIQQLGYRQYCKRKQQIQQSEEEHHEGHEGACETVHCLQGHMC